MAAEQSLRKNRSEGSDKNSWYNSVLDTVYPVMVKYLDTRPLSRDSSLSSSKLFDFSPWLWLTIYGNVPDSERNEIVMNYVKGRGKHGYDWLMEYLQETNQNALENYLAKVGREELTHPDAQLLELQQSIRMRNDEHIGSEGENPGKELHQMVLDCELTVILECLVPHPILDEFIKKHFLPFLDIRNTRELPTTTEKNREIVKHVRAKGKQGYDVFKDCLSRTNQTLLRTYLERIETRDDTGLEELRKELKSETDERERREKRKDVAEYDIEVNGMEEVFTIVINHGKDFTGKEDIKEKLNVHGSTSKLDCCDTIKHIIEQGTADIQFKSIVIVVNEMNYLIGVKISEAEVEGNNSVSLKMTCSSCEEMRRVLKTLKGDEFQTVIRKLSKALEETYDDSFEIQAQVDTKTIRQVHDNLRKQGVFDDQDGDRFCDQHPDTLGAFYCSDDNAFCCEDCAHTTHRKCSGVRQCTAYPMLESEDGQTDLTFNQKKEYRVRVDEPKLCSTQRSCILPNGEIIIIDNFNSRLKKLDILYKVSGYCKLLSPPFDVCCVEDGKIVVSFGCFVQFVDVKQDPALETEKKLTLKNVCIRLAWHNNFFYYTDNSSVYKCDAEGKQQEIVHTFGDNELTCKKLAVSKDGKKIYIAAGEEGLFVVNIESETSGDQSYPVFINRELKDCTDICVVSHKSLLVCDYESQAVFQIAAKDGTIIRKVIEETDGLHHPWSLSFDKADSTMIVGRLGRDFISVFQRQISDE